MKIISLSIDKLYGYYNYSVEFNPDVTFIYGMNGCGKTTILNITEAIITGQLFKLFNYNFKKIKLKYAKSTELNNIQTIFIISEKTKLYVDFNDDKYVIDLINTNENIHSNVRDISHIYFNRYSFLNNISEIFNYVYLPLNRSYIPYDETEEFYTYQRIHNRFVSNNDIYIDKNTSDGAMLKIESLIYKNSSRASAMINRINDTFRNNILKSQLELNDSYNFEDFFKEIENNSISTLQETQNSYIKILKELNLINESEEEKYNKFFTDFINDFSSYLDKESDSHIPFDLFLKFKEISKIQKTLDIAKKMEQRKTAVQKPMETFLNTMNSFIRNNDEEKEVYIHEGQVYFKTKYNSQISIQHLSSGEKQLITFFANLIFNVKDKSSGIFVVDEPELSLHLSWQNIFVDKVLEINDNIQLIFATHAPEIIGSRRNKMFKLEKKYTKVE